jgi:hypothetical protein
MVQRVLWFLVFQHPQVGNLKEVYHFLKPVNGFLRTKSVSGVPVQYGYTLKLQEEENVRC